jgi:hypothetical protein
MRYQKTLLSFDVNVYTAQSTLTYHAAQQKKRRLLRRTTSRVGGKRLSVEVYVWAIMWCETQPQQKLQAATPANDVAIKARTRERMVMETPAKQAPTASSEIVMLIRKLRWVGLEEKAEQLEKELEQRAVSDRVVPIQNDTD